MIIKGKWHAQGSAAQCGATLSVTDDHLFSVKTEEGLNFTEKLESLKVSDRLGNVERKITLEDGSIFVTLDNDAVDRLLKEHKGGTGLNGLVHRLESHLGWVGVALVVTVLFSFAFFKWGVPWTSMQIAHALPHKTNQLISSNTLEFLDKYMFTESYLDQEKQDQIREHFKTKIAPLSIKEDSDIEYKLHFRSWDDLPNAFALPSGDIVVTDKFIELTKNQDEIDSVLLHEMGHVVNRHTLEMVIESTFVTVVVMMVTGDSNGFADMGVGLGSVMVSSNYSRNHESEADLYAFKHMLEAKIDPKAFAGIMNRMTRFMEEREDKSEEEKEKQKGNDDGFLDYLSSHPSTKKRVEIARQYSECFKQGLTSCDVVIPE